MCYLEHCDLSKEFSQKPLEHILNVVEERWYFTNEQHLRCLNFLLDLFFIVMQVDCRDYRSGKKTISEESQRSVILRTERVRQGVRVNWFCFSDTANGCKQAEYHIASDISPRSGSSTGTVTSANSYQQTHCKYQGAVCNKMYLFILNSRKFIFLSLWKSAIK